MYTQLFRPQPMGAVTVVAPGNPVSLVSGLIANGLCLAGDPVGANKIDIQSLPANRGSVYVGFAGMNRATLANVVAVLTTGGEWSITNNVGVDTYAVEKMYIDADNTGDGIYGTIDTN